MQELPSFKLCTYSSSHQSWYHNMRLWSISNIGVINRGEREQQTHSSGSEELQLPSICKRVTHTHKRTMNAHMNVHEHQTHTQTDRVHVHNHTQSIICTHILHEVTYHINWNIFILLKMSIIFFREV